LLDKLNIWPLDFGFNAPHWLWLLVGIPFVGFFLFQKSKNKSNYALTTAKSSDLKKISLHWIPAFKVGNLILQCSALALLVLALANPVSINSKENRIEDYKNGIDIVLALDVSLSMYARDFKPNRIAASKKVAADFVRGRTGDRIGLVVYAGEAYTACPSTLDYRVLINQINEVTGEYIDGGTAIGVGLATAVARLRRDSTSTKIIILLTDGTNNSGNVSPEIAAELAASKNIRVYTIGMGTNGLAESPVVTPFGIRYQRMPVEIDEKTLQIIAQKTNGQYFRATDEKKLEEIYKEIESIETKLFLSDVRQNEPPSQPEGFLFWGLILFIASWTMHKSVLRYE
jgi:Ca-activated chloride channel family protein